MVLRCDAVFNSTQDKKFHIDKRARSRVTTIFNGDVDRQLWLWRDHVGE
jgi:hypothetical protein